jgi:hypothetical protein
MPPLLAGKAHRTARDTAETFPFFSRPRLPDRIFARAGREFLLATACCSWPSNDARLAAIRRAASLPIEWPEFLRIVDVHRIWGLVHDGLMAAAVEVPPDVAREIAGLASSVAHQNLALAAEALRLQRLFDDAKIPVVFLKGVALAMLAYGTLALKHGKDIDILVSSGDFAAATPVLERAGYQLREPPPGLSGAQMRAIARNTSHYTFVHCHAGHIVELHWRLAANPYLLQSAAAVPTRPVALTDNAGIVTLAEPDLLAYLFAHGASHGWCRIKWLADLAALLNARVDEIEALYRSAHDAGVGHCAGAALLLCERLLGLAVPRALLSELRGVARLRLLEAVALHAMLGGTAETASPSQRRATILISFSRLLLGDGPRYWLHEARRLLFRLDEVVAVPLPARLEFLYPVLHLALSIWRHLPFARRTDKSSDAIP